jgi:hypothetical protein
MSFLRHRQIYQSDGAQFLCRERAAIRLRPRPHRLDESAVGYSLAGCSPALPASALPTSAIILWFNTKAKDFAANGNLSLISLSHLKGAVPNLSLISLSHLKGAVPG